MQDENTLPSASVWRRSAAALALCCYLFAATLGAIWHNAAMAGMIGPAGVTAGEGGGHEHAAAAHDHESEDGHGEQAPAPAGAPCAQNCILCQSCSPSAVLAAPMHSGEAIAVAYAVSWAMPAQPLPAGHIGALPSEPPRV